MSELLAALTEDQQRLVEVVAAPFLSSDFTWPFFDYVEGTLEREQKDAWAILESFPERGRWRYRAVRYAASPAMKPAPEMEIALTVVGMYHVAALREYAGVFFQLVDYLVARRRQVNPSPRTVRELTVTSDECREHLLSSRRLAVEPRLSYHLLEGEPPTYGQRTFEESTGRWTRVPRRDLEEFAGIVEISDYVDRLERRLQEPAVPVAPILPSPLSLAAALDYLNVVWRLTHDGQRLLELQAAERTARLAFEVRTAEEFDAHLSALAEILRSANARAAATRVKRDRARPLARLEADALTHVGDDAAARVSSAIHVLEAAVAIRDAAQHTPATDRALLAFRELGIEYPPTDWATAWTTLAARVVEALVAVREELAATMP